MDILITGVKFYTEVKSQTSLSSLRVSCKRALRGMLHVGEARSFKTAIYRTFVRRVRKDVTYCFDKNHDECTWCQN